MTKTQSEVIDLTEVSILQQVKKKSINSIYTSQESNDGDIKSTSSLMKKSKQQIKIDFGQD